MAKTVVKGSFHSGRARGSDKHNDHDFMGEKKNVKIKTYAYTQDIEDMPDKEINLDPLGQSQSTLNFVISEHDIEKLERKRELENRCCEDELKFYKHCFGKTLDLQNAKHKKAGHRKRMKNMEQFKKAYPPSEDILQVGNMDTGNIPPDVLETCVDELMEWERKTLGRNYMPISVAFHYDETTYHAQKRGVYVFWDEDGNPIPCQKDALKQAGIPLSDPTKEESQYNNRKKAYDVMRREEWLNIVEKHLPKDFVLDKTVDKSREFGHMTVDVYTAYKAAETANKAEAERLQAREDELNSQELILDTREIDLDERETALNERETLLQADRAALEGEKEKYKAEIEKELKTAYTALETDLKDNYERKEQQLKMTYASNVKRFEQTVKAYNLLAQYSNDYTAAVVQQQAAKQNTSVDIEQRRVERLKALAGQDLSWSDNTKDNNGLSF